MVPPCDELDEMIQDSCCVVEGFTIGRRGFGEIHFPDKTDVYGMNLDQLGEELRIPYSRKFSPGEEFCYFHHLLSWGKFLSHEFFLSLVNDYNIEPVVTLTAWAKNCSENFYNAKLYSTMLVSSMNDSIDFSLSLSLTHTHSLSSFD